MTMVGGPSRAHRAPMPESSIPVIYRAAADPKEATPCPMNPPSPSSTTDF